MSSNKRKTKQLTESKNGKDRDYLAKLLQQRTMYLKYIKSEYRKQTHKLNQIKKLVAQHNMDLDTLRALVVML
jgi:hypothetical protein